MPAGSYNIRIEQGATLSMQATLRDGANAPVNFFTGWTGASQIKKKYTDAAPLARITVAFNSPPTDGVIKLTMSASDTWKLPVDPPSDATRKVTQYVYDFVLTKPDSTAFRILEGIVEVSPGVTRGT